jgi:calcium-independent phospholipase A2-gamma
MESSSRYAGECEVKVWEALRASTAAPSYFDMFTRDGKVFRDGGMIANNPASIALHEAKCLWPDKRIDMLLSVGTGVTTVQPVAHPNTYSQLLSQIANACAETEKTHGALQDTLPHDVYARLQPMDDLFAVGIDETSSEKLEQLRDVTVRWIAKNDERFMALARSLVANPAADRVV